MKDGTAIDKIGRNRGGLMKDMLHIEREVKLRR